MPPFLDISAEELSRAQRRLGSPEWEPARERLQKSAAEAAAKFAALPVFDSAWYDADPTRDFLETYELFAAYSYDAMRLAELANELVVYGALSSDAQYSAVARSYFLHLIDHMKFHVQHHDAGLVYARIAIPLANIYTHLSHTLTEHENARFVMQLNSVGAAIRQSTAHWLKNLARMPYNNHFAHHRQALLAVGLAINNTDWQTEALTGPRNFGELLAGSTTDDGLCYESSTIYHYVTLAGLLHTASLVAHHPQLGRDFFRESFANGRSLKDMFDAPLNMLLPTGEMPSVGDCYNVRTPLWKHKAAMYEQAYAVYKDPRYAWLIQKAGPRASFNALVYGVDTLESAAAPCPKTKVWLEHRYGLLTSKPIPSSDYWNSHAAFITGDLSGIHHHKDALSIQLALGGKLWLEDVESNAVEQQKFAAAIQRNFNRTMLPHNLVVVDQQDQCEIAAPLPITEFKDCENFPTIAMADPSAVLTKGVVRLRHLALTPDYCLDLYQLRSETGHTYDFVMHPRTDTPIELPLGLSNPIALPGTPPYSVLRNPTSTSITDNGVTLKWSQQNVTFTADISTNHTAELISAQWPTKSDNTGPWRTLLMLRITAQSVYFLALYQLRGQDSPPWKILSATRLYNGLSHEFRITTSNSKHSRAHTFTAL